MWKFWGISKSFSMEFLSSCLQSILNTRVMTSPPSRVEENFQACFNAFANPSEHNPVIDSFLRAISRIVHAENFPERFSSLFLKHQTSHSNSWGKNNVKPWKCFYSVRWKSIEELKIQESIVQRKLTIRDTRSIELSFRLKLSWLKLSFFLLACNKKLKSLE